MFFTWLKLVRYNYISALSLKYNFISALAGMILNDLFLVLFWIILFSKFETVRGYDFSDILLIYGLVAGSFGLATALFGSMRDLSCLINQRQLDGMLLRPMPPLLLAITARAEVFGLGDLLFGIGCFIFSGRIQLADIGIVAILLISSALIFTSFMVITSSLAFWFKKLEFGELLINGLLSFSLYPEELFAGGIKFFLYLVLPVGFYAFVPVEILRQPEWSAALIHFGVALIFLAIAQVVFNRGLNKYLS